MTTNPNNLENFSMGEVTPVLQGKVDSGTLDYFQMGEVFPGITAPAPALSPQNFAIPIPVTSGASW